ncbi:hypothetical protein [Arthrobacter psychrolactophilus]
MNSPKYPARFVGLDIGGSKTRGIVWSDGVVSSDVSVGSTNVQNVSKETAAENMAELFGLLDATGAHGGFCRCRWHRYGRRRRRLECLDRAFRS